MSTSEESIAIAECGQIMSSRKALNSFVSQRETLQEICQDLDSVAGKLYSRGIISNTTHSYATNKVYTPEDRTTELLNAVESQIRVKPSVFKEFIFILDESSTIGSQELYAKYLKGMYRRSLVNVDDKWPPTPSRKYVKLSVVNHALSEVAKYTIHGDVEGLLKNKEEIVIEDILKPTQTLSPLSLVLIEGPSGVGKSSLSWELCRRWDEIPCMGQYRLVVLLGLREILVQQAKAVADLFYHVDSDLQQSVAKEVVSSEGKGVLFILDGFDELPSSLRRDGLLIDLITGHALPKSTVTVTSKPSATVDLLRSCRPRVQKHIEILGFTQESVKEYASSVFSSEPKLLQDFLAYISASNNPAINSLMYIPLNAAIVVEVYRNSRRIGVPIPKTLTQLYTQLCLTLIQRYMMIENEQFSDVILNQFTDLTANDHHHFLKLSEVAFEGFKRDEVIFHDLPENLVHFGLLIAVVSQYDEGRVSYNFLHYTIQLFLVAYHISQCSHHEGIVFFKQYGSDECWNMVWRFIAGLTAFEYFSDETVVTSKAFVTIEKNESKLSSLFIHCLSEAQIKFDYKATFGTDKVSARSVDMNDVADRYALYYCIANCVPTASWIGLSIETISQFQDFFVSATEFGKPASIYLAAYNEVIEMQGFLDMLFLKMLFVGPPGLGKTTARRRLTGEIVDITSAGERSNQASTGVIESGHSVFVRNLTSTTAVVTQTEWSAINNLTEEASMLLELIYSNYREQTSSQVISKKSSEEKASDPEKDISEKREATVKYETDAHSSPSNPPQQQSRVSEPQRTVPEMLRTALKSEYWKDIKHHFKDATLLRMEDAGGQPELMDMLPALTIGPGLYLLFCRLIDDLKSHYKVSYLRPSIGESTIPLESTFPVDSTHTVEEVLLTALASVACFNSYSPSEVTNDEAILSSANEFIASSSKSIAYIIGTHKDLVTDKQVDEFDQKLQDIVKSTYFFHKNLLQFSSADRMILPIDNMKGGEDEILKIRKFLEESIQKHFKKLRIPVAWLVLSLFLRKRTAKTISMKDCQELAGQFGMSSAETDLALWFLHHHAGFLMYYPKLPKLENTVICDVQIVYDSVSNLIVKTYGFESVGKRAYEKFQKTGQFSLEDIKGATNSVSGDYLPLDQLVELLVHLNIIARIENADPQDDRDYYFMPCVLQNAPEEELHIQQSDSLFSTSLMIRYECGYVPLGLFPATIANLVGQKSKGEKWMLKKTDVVKKNKVMFLVGNDFTKVTLISRPRFYEVAVENHCYSTDEMHAFCVKLKDTITETLKKVSSNMNYGFSLSPPQISFECPRHPGRDHLCVIAEGVSNPKNMLCLLEEIPLPLEPKHSMWFEAHGAACDDKGLCSPPSMIDIIRFKLAQGVGDKYFTFGILLLDDKTGARIGAIEREKMKNAKEINLQVFGEWVQGEGKNPVSWKTLISVLEDCELNQLATSIKANLCL